MRKIPVQFDRLVIEIDIARPGLAWTDEDRAPLFRDSLLGPIMMVNNDLLAVTYIVPTPWRHGLTGRPSGGMAL